jgi:uncharacterized protein (TIGR00369 family)
MSDKPLIETLPAERIAQFQEWFSDSIPHNKALGMRIVGFRRGHASMSIDWQAHLVGNPETGVLHGGAITAMLDACSGMAVATMLKAPEPFATLDLRIDYTRPATPHQPVIAEAECYRLTANVAFTRAIAHQGDRNNPVAGCAGTFMMGTKGKSLRAQAVAEALKDIGPAEKGS